MNKLMICAGALIAAAAVQTPAFAHHSAAMFDKDKTLILDGTVKAFQFTNPHSWLQVVVVDSAGKSVEWSFESEGPSTLLRSGIKLSSFVPGEKVQVKTHPMKDGRAGGSMVSVTKADGTVLGLGISHRTVEAQ